MNLRTAFLTVSVLAIAVACTPAANEPVPAAPEAAPIAEAAPPSGPAAENTTDSLSTTTLSTTPAAESAAAPAPATPAAPAATAGLTTAELTSARGTYAASCAMCHGSTGQGTQMGVALANGLEAEVIKEKVIKGIVNPGDKMPPMGAALSADQLDALAKFVASGLPA